jgi:hypothetical protein
MKITIITLATLMSLTILIFFLDMALGSRDASLPFQSVQKISKVLQTKKVMCPPQEGILVSAVKESPKDFVYYSVFLFKNRAIIINEDKIGEAPVWFVEVDKDGNFELKFVVKYKDLQEKVLNPCDWLVVNTDKKGEQ